MAESVVYCNVVMNLDEFNILNKSLFTLTFMYDFTVGHCLIVEWLIYRLFDETGCEP